jgi:NAD(P)-dependent dehydrogenase (short-subunit alcohol dehydrogenase family)
VGVLTRLPGTRNATCLEPSRAPQVNDHSLRFRATHCDRFTNLRIRCPEAPAEKASSQLAAGSSEAAAPTRTISIRRLDRLGICFHNNSRPLDRTETGTAISGLSRQCPIWSAGMDPDGKVIVVTGAAGGIGGALVRALLERGARKVVAADLERDGLERLGEELGTANVAPRALDVTDEDATRALVEEVEGTVGPIDVWFANAGLSTGGGAEAPNEVWDRQWRVNVMSHVFAARALLPGWLERGDGHLVTTASMAGILTAAGDAVYSTTKHAAVGFAEWLAFTHAGRGVRVSCICPGAVDTAMLRAGAGGDAVKASAVIGGGDVLAPEQAAERILDGLEQGLFLILTHPEMHEFVVGKGEDPERWIRGMTKLWSRAQELLG